jgi:aminopeptidase N
MKPLNKVLFFISIIGLSFAQNSPEQNPSAGKAVFTDPIMKGKSALTKILQLHLEYDVLLYDINVTIFPDSQKIMANTSIGFVVTINMENNLVFDFTGLQLDSIFLDSDPAQGSIQGDLLVLNLETPLMTGDTHFVSIHYQGTPEKGLYFRLNSANDMVIYSHNEPYDAHFWFPCKDDPSDKAKLIMTIAVPEDLIVLSNGVLIDKTDIGSQYNNYFWQEEYPIATYLISIAAGSYLITTDTFTWENVDLLLEYYVYPTDLTRGATVLEMVKDMLDFYSGYIGEYPFFSDKYSMSEVPFREASAMENQTSTTMGDFVMDREDVIAHELAHQWWGDALTPQSFADIWLNEGFATYFDALFTEYKYGEEAFQKRMDDFYNFIVSDGSLAFPIYNPPPEYLFGRAVYMKGAWVLNMLRKEVGDQIFNEIIQQYYEEYNYLNVITGLFIDVVESVSGKSFVTFFDQWLNYGGMPLLVGSWEQNKYIVKLSVSQNQSAPVYKFDLEVLIEGVSTDTLVVIPVIDRESQLSISFVEPVSKMIIDPNNKILNTNNSPVYNIPTQSGLVWLYPNPFNESITITYQIEKAEKVEIIVYDVLGEIVESLLNEKKTTGIHQIDWDGSRYATGTYYCVLNTSGSSDVRKMTLIR